MTQEPGVIAETCPCCASEDGAECGAVLGERARKAVERALMDRRDEWLTVTQHGTVRDYVAAAEFVLDALRPHVAALVAQARAEMLDGPLHGAEPDAECPCYPQSCTCDTETLMAEVARLRSNLTKERQRYAEETERCDRTYADLADAYERACQERDQARAEGAADARRDAIERLRGFKVDPAVIEHFRSLLPETGDDR